MINKNNMINVYFIRDNGKRQQRGYIADVPYNGVCNYTKPFIIIQVDESTIPEEWLNDNTIHLDLDKLMNDYPNKIEEYVDEDGEVHEKVIYGYFHEHGNSVCVDAPIITINNVLRGKDE